MAWACRVRDLEAGLLSARRRHPRAASSELAADPFRAPWAVPCGAAYPQAAATPHWAREGQVEGREGRQGEVREGRQGEGREGRQGEVREGRQGEVREGRQGEVREGRQGEGHEGHQVAAAACRARKRVVGQGRVPMGAFRMTSGAFLKTVFGAASALSVAEA
jgi:hypothetical protein